MLVLFLLRLGLGLLVCLLLLSPGRSARPTPERKAIANAHFFRTQLLVVLGLTVGALLWIWPENNAQEKVALLLGASCALVGSVSWSLEGSPGGVVTILGATVSLGMALVERELEAGPVGGGVALLAGGLSSALLLGAATSAMLMGHNYLVAPNLTMTPLYRLLTALAVALALRTAVDGWALGQWTLEHDLARLTADARLWLPVRWGVGLIAPAVLCAMAWQTARIRSTQSATGILYVVVIFCFLGELTGQLLRPAGLTM